MNKQVIKLSEERKEFLTDELLKYMNSKAEEAGVTINCIWFDFTPAHTKKYFNAPDELIPDTEELTELKKAVNITNEEITIIIKSCLSNEYIKGREPESLMLTRTGKARANSVSKATNYKTTTDTNFNFNGAVYLNNSAIGNGNTINIENSIETILKLIEETRTTQEEKKTLKTQFTDFLKHPAITPILAKYGIDLIQKIKGIF